MSTRNHVMANISVDAITAATILKAFKKESAPVQSYASMFRIGLKCLADHYTRIYSLPPLTQVEAIDYLSSSSIRVQKSFENRMINAQAKELDEFEEEEIAKMKKEMQANNEDEIEAKEVMQPVDLSSAQIASITAHFQASSEDVVNSGIVNLPERAESKELTFEQFSSLPRFEQIISGFKVLDKQRQFQNCMSIGIFTTLDDISDNLVTYFYSPDRSMAPSLGQPKYSSDEINEMKESFKKCPEEFKFL